MDEHRRKRLALRIVGKACFLSAVVAIGCSLQTSYAHNGALQTSPRIIKTCTLFTEYGIHQGHHELDGHSHELDHQEMHQGHHAKPDSHLEYGLDGNSINSKGRFLKKENPKGQSLEGMGEGTNQLEDQEKEPLLGDSRLETNQSPKNYKLWPD